MKIQDGQAFHADEVVMALPPAAEQRVRGASPPTRDAAAATLCLGLRRLPRPERTFVLGIDEPLYFSDHSATAELGPGRVVHVARYLAPGETGARDGLEAWVDQLQPGWRDELLFSRFLPRIRVAGLPTSEPVPAAVAPGLWRCGDHVGARGLLADAALASAEEVAEAIAGRARMSA